MKKHSIKLYGHPTSITLEEEFWVSLNKIANEKNITIQALIEGIDQQRLLQEPKNNLSSATRIFILNHFIER